MKYLIEDSSFIVSLLNSDDPLHGDAYNIFVSILRTDKLTVIIPSIVLEEVLFVLLRNGISSTLVVNKLQRMLKIKRIEIYSIEKNLFNLVENFKKILALPYSFKANDSSIVSCAMKYQNSYLLTSDVKMRNRHKNVYPNICCFQDIDNCNALETFFTS